MPRSLLQSVAAVLLAAGGFARPADDPKPPVVAKPAPPPGWAVNTPDGFAGGLDQAVCRNGRGSLVLRKTAGGEGGAAVALQEVRADRYRGRRVRLAGYLKTEAADPGAGLWLRVDAAGGAVALDNMGDRKVAGTAGWTRCEVMLDVPADAVRLAFGVLQYGAGTVWADDLELEAVKPDVPATRNLITDPVKGPAVEADDLPTEPFNLTFEAAAGASARSHPLPTADETAWLKAHAVRFATDDPAADPADLAPLKAAVGDATVVGLGEGTHGTREHFRMKHRLTEFLVRQKGFTHFLIEANGPETERVNAYVLGGPGDAKAVVAGMLFWTWNTEEVVALVEWLRGYNKTAAAKVQFLGFDMQTGELAVADTKAFLAKADPGYTKTADDAFAKLAGYWGAGPAARKAVDKLPPAEKVALGKQAQAVADHIDANRQKYAETLPAAEVARTVRTARVAAQAVGAIGKFGTYRDQCMADNVRHVLDRAPAGAKAVLWAHNGHVHRQPGWMGHHLAKAYGDRYLVVGFAAGAGTYTAVERGRGLKSDNPLAPPAAGSPEERFRAAGLDRAVLDLRTAAKEPGGKWVTERRPFRTVGALAMTEQFGPAKLAEWYDLLVYFDKTGATRCFGFTRPPAGPKGDPKK